MLHSADWCVSHTGTIHWKVVNVTSNDPGSSWVVFIDFVYCVPKNNSIWVVLSEEQMSKEWLCSILDGPRTMSNWSCVTGTCPLTYCQQGVIKSMTGWLFDICFIFIPMWGKDLVWLMFFRWVETTKQMILPTCFQTQLSWTYTVYTVDGEETILFAVEFTCISKLILPDFEKSSTSISDTRCGWCIYLSVKDRVNDRVV